MPSQAMQDVIDTLRGQQKAAASQPSLTLEQRRAAFAPRRPPSSAAGRRGGDGRDRGRGTRPLAGRPGSGHRPGAPVPARWGYELGSLRSDGELAARLGRASGMRVLFPEYRLAPEYPFPAAIDDVLTAWHWLRTKQDLPAASMAVAGASAAEGSPSPCWWPCVTPGSPCPRPPS